MKKEKPIYSFFPCVKQKSSGGKIIRKPGFTHEQKSFYSYYDKVCYTCYGY